jgi:hypothetical protein
VSMRDRWRNQESDDNYRALTWQSLLLMGLNSSEVRGAIIVSWRITNAVALLWVTGWLGTFGYPGPARAIEMNIIKEEARSTRLEGLEARMFDLRVKQCEALKAGESQRAFTVQLQQLQEKYASLTMRRLDLPTCQELS